MTDKTHYSVLLKESIDNLNINPDGIYVDCTFGRGGHSRAILEKLSPKGLLIAFDRDLTAYQHGLKLHEQDNRFLIVHAPFSKLSECLFALEITEVDGILADFGVSSPQIDEAERGFSFRFNAPLDMRMDQTRGQTVADYLATCEEKELADIIFHYGEERFSRQIARAICQSETRPTTTKQLAELISSIIKKPDGNQHPATRTFQALRIFINQELLEIKMLLEKSINKLKPNGRLCCISFHSLEDRIVKQFFHQLANPAKDIPKDLPLRNDQLPQPIIKLIKKAIKPSNEEITENPRSRSAVLRIAEKI